MIKLSFYLLRKTVETWDDALNEEALEEVVHAREEDDDELEPGWAEARLDSAVLSEDVRVYHLRDTAEAPHWAEWLDSIGVRWPAPPQTRYDALLVVVRVRDKTTRFIAVTAGRGRAGLNNKKVVNDFGRRVVLNATPVDQLLLLRELGMDLTRRQRSSALARPGDAGAFGLDFLGARVDRAAGRLASEVPGELNGRVEGGRGLAINVSGGPDCLPDLCKMLLDLYGRDDYQEKFPFADRWVPLDPEEPLIAELNPKLFQTLAGQNAKSFSASFPADWERILDARELFISRARKVRLGAFTEVEIRDAIIKLGAGPDEIDTVDVRGFDSDGKVRYQRLLLQHVLYEADHEGKHYIYADGQWYFIPETIVTEVSALVDAVGVYSDANGDPISLPAYSWVWDAGKQIWKLETEGQYNERVASLMGFALLDQVFFKDGMGHGKIEPCDLFSSEGDFIHVKRLGSGSPTQRAGGGQDDAANDTKASGMSHLFTQGTVSAQLYADSLQFREWLRDQVEAQGLTWRWQTGLPNKAEHTVVFGVVCAPSRDIPTGLPFLIKAAFYQKLVELNRMGYNVRVAKIPYQPKPPSPPS